MTIGERLRAAREMAGFKTAADACRHFGRKYPTYSQSERDERSIPRDLGDYAKAFGVEYEWLRYGRGAPPDESRHISRPDSLTSSKNIRIPIIGKVGASAFREVTESLDDETADTTLAAPHARFPRARHMAFRIEGDSMNAAIPPLPDGTVIHAVDWVDTGYTPINGMIVVVEEAMDGGQVLRWTVKEVEVENRIVRLLPRSTNPRHKPIEIPVKASDDGRTIRILALVYGYSGSVGVF